MTRIEVILLILSLLAGFCLIYFEQLFRLSKRFFARKKPWLRNLSFLIKSIYQVLLKLRRFSFVYVLKNRYYRIYLAIATTVILTKIGFHYQPQTSHNAPIWIHKITDFLIISSAWELICLATKIIEQKLNQKS